MASKVIRGSVPGYDGATALYAIVTAQNGATSLNGAGGDTVTFGALNTFTFTWTESITGGVYDVQLYKTSDNSEYTKRSKVYVPSDAAGTYDIDDVSALNREGFNNQVYPSVIRSVDDTNAIGFLFPTANATFTTKTVSIDFGTATNIQGTISYIGTLGNSYEYQLAYDADDRPTAEGTARYTFSDGTNTRYVTLNVTARGSIVVVQPIAGTVIDDVGSTTLNYRLNEQKSYSVTCTDGNGNAVTLTGMTLTITFERLGSVTDKAVVNSGDITISGSTFTFTNPAAVTNEVGQLKWDLWNGTTWLMGGIATVDSAAKKDA